MEDNRNCNCNDNYNDMNDNNEAIMDEMRNCRERDEMLEEIKSKNFAIIELALYLNTHPDDERALTLHRRYCKELKDLKDKYQKFYGPLSIYYPCKKWRWLEEPWPWEGGMN